MLMPYIISTTSSSSASSACLNLSRSREFWADKTRAILGHDLERHELKHYQALNGQQQCSHRCRQRVWSSETKARRRREVKKTETGSAISSTSLSHPMDHIESFDSVCFVLCAWRFSIMCRTFTFHPRTNHMSQQWLFNRIYPLILSQARRSTCSHEV